MPLAAGFWLSSVRGFFFLVDRVKGGENFLLPLRSWETYYMDGIGTVVTGTAICEPNSCVYNEHNNRSSERHNNTYLPIGSGRHDRKWWYRWFARRWATIGWVVFLGNAIGVIVISRFDLFLHSLLGHGSTIPVSLDTVSSDTSG